MNQNAYGRAEWADFLKKNPKFEAWGKRYYKENEAYFKKRPQRPIWTQTKILSVKQDKI